MAYRNSERQQITMFPRSIEEYVSKDDPVRVYDAFVEALNFNELGIRLNDNKVGNPEYNPVAMVKLLIYGYSYGFRSSRKLERALCHNVSFIWLIGGLTPDHKTIANFRKNNKKALKNILKQCAQLCVKLNLIEGNTLFVDGSKIRANASIKNSWTSLKCERHLKKIDARIESILDECEKIDEQEHGQGSLVQLQDDLKDATVLKDKILTIMKELKEHNKESTNTVDPDCRPMKSVHGSHASYNTQLVVDEKNGMIVNSDVVNDATDINQFAEQINQANEVLDKPCNTACADAGYADTEELQKIDEQNITVIVPSQRQALHHEARPFNKEQFHYDSDNDRYLCPEGHHLTYSFNCPEKKHRVYQISHKSICHSCRYFGICTNSKNGRRIRRLELEHVKEKLETQYKQVQSQAIYKLRKQKAELPFGHLKRNLGVKAFLLRGLEGTRAEISLLANCFNIARMITIFGVRPLISKLV